MAGLLASFIDGGTARHSDPHTTFPLNRRLPEEAQLSIRQAKRLSKMTVANVIRLAFDQNNRRGRSAVLPDIRNRQT